MARVAEIILVRHASTAWTGHRYCGLSDPPLDRPGRAAATALAADLAPTIPATARIVSSPARRTLETAAALAAGAGLGPVEIDPRWSEADFGIAAGRTFEELERIAPALARALAAGDMAIDWPDGETAARLLDRVTAAWRAVVESERDTVLVSHAGPIRIAIGLAGRGSGRDWVPLAPGAVIRLAVGTAWRTGSRARLSS